MRATIRDLLIGSVPLTALIPPERWFQAGSIKDVPVVPFAVLRWLSPVAGEARGTWFNLLQVEIHDKRGSYARIDSILGDPNAGGGVYEVLSSILDHAGSDGRITQADYLGHSGDQEDPDYKTNKSFSSWQVIGRRL